MMFGCVSERSAAEAGADRFQDPSGLSESLYNPFSCATCHQTGSEPEPGRIAPGYSLYGVAARASTWGGYELRLLDAVNVCLVYFMRGEALDESSAEGRQLYEYLLSITPDDAAADPLPMTIVEDIIAITPGDASAGEAIYEAACASCHGEPHTGVGSIIMPSPIVLPEYAEGYDTTFPGVPHGLILIEKTRHGRFYDIGGVMPPFSLESLSDAQIGDLLAFLGLETE